jgi:hypothetical protein
MELRTCDHLKEDGIYCQSPALKGRDYCYFHLNLRGRRLNMARNRALAADQPLDLPFPEDMHSVQVTLFEVVNALVNKRIDTKTAGIVLYAMQQASTNLSIKHASQSMCPAVKPDEPLLALEFRDFEEQYHLPKGIDLQANPDVALQESGALPEMTVAHNSLAIVGSHQEALPVETTPGLVNNGPNSDQNNHQMSDRKKRRKHHHRGERVPLPKGLWKVVDPDAPFRAYTSDGRELTRQDAERWQKRVYAEMQAFVEHGGAPGWDKDIEDIG